MRIESDGVFVAQCPTVHVGEFEGVFRCLEEEDGWRLEACDMGCSPAVIWEASNIGRRVPGDDDDAKPEKPAAKPKSKLLSDHILKLTRASLRATPPPREYMLKDSRTGAGVFVQGKVGLLAADGGSGKTWALVQLAVAVASGMSWMGSGGWVPVKIGRVLLVLAEEDQEEVDRRLYYAIQASGLFSDEQLDLVASNVDAMGLTGFGVALTQQDFGKAALPETAFTFALRELVERAAQAGRPYTLIILDPLSRFAGPDVETDNAAATRWVQVIETFCAPEFGKPSMVVAHHLKKKGAGGEKEGDSESSDPIRGASALVAGVRWAARLAQQKRSADAADLLTLRLVKANGVPPQLIPLILARDQKHEGALRIATKDEIDSHEGVSNLLKNKDQKVKDHQARVLEVLKPGQTYSRNQIISLIKGKRELGLEAIRQLLLAGELEESRRGQLTLSQPTPVPDGSQAPGTDRNSQLEFGSRHPPPPSLKEGGVVGTNWPKPPGTKPETSSQVPHLSVVPGTKKKNETEDKP